jgi:hypothetical protein
MPPSWAKNLTQGFGPTDEVLDGPYNGWAHFNKGYDYGLPEGTPIEFNVGGTVIGVSEDPNNSTNWGKYVWIQDAAGNIHRYNHLSMVGGWDVGDSVTPGQLAGKVGSTGHSTGPHLSYDVTDASGQFIDPGQFIDGSNTSYSGGNMASSPEVLEAFTRWSSYNGKKENWAQRVEAGEDLPYPFTAEEDAQFVRDNVIVDSWLKELGEGGSGTTVDDILRQYEFWDETDPKLIDATNSANRYARELDQRNLAAEISATLLREANQMQVDAVESRQKMFAVNPETGSMSRQPGGSLVGRLSVPTGDELFSQSLNKIKESLPEVTDIPYRTRPAGSPGSFAGVSSGGGGTSGALASILGSIASASGNSAGRWATEGAGLLKGVEDKAKAASLSTDRNSGMNAKTRDLTGGAGAPVVPFVAPSRPVQQAIPTPGIILNKPKDTGGGPVSSAFRKLKGSLFRSPF